MRLSGCPAPCRPDVPLHTITMCTPAVPPIKHDDTERLLEILQKYRRIMLWGDMGTGKSTLAVHLLQLAASRSPALLLELDPGTPPFGVPGSIAVGCFRNNQVGHQWIRPLCSLNSARFRLPLLLEAQRLLRTAMQQHPQSAMLIDPPGVVRGVAGAELLTALATSLEPGALLVLSSTDTVPLQEELGTLNIPLFPIIVSPAARNPTPKEKARSRTLLWNRFLEQAGEERFDLHSLRHLGTPPPLSSPESWQGRQIALFTPRDEIIGLGEVVALVGTDLTASLVRFSAATPKTLLIRDAARNPEGMLSTINPQQSPSHQHPPPSDLGVTHRPQWNRLSPALSNRVGAAWATLVGGVFGDPLLHVRLRNQKRSFFFDLGDPRRLQAKIAHQVEAVFLSHAHLDHIGGFIWFLRCRIGPFGPCRIYGPPGISRRISHFIQAITWDRIADLGPVFDIAEIHEGTLLRKRLQPGKKVVSLPAIRRDDDIIMEDDLLCVRAVICDHGIPSAAYSLEFAHDVSVRKDQLTQLGLAPGPWLGKLKDCIATGSLQTTIILPDGSKATAERLAEKLILIRPGKKLAYIADMADTAANRQKAIRLARGAHTLYCEAAFTRKDRERAKATQHLTTTAAVHIACTAGVRQLVPFHFSKRYESARHQVYKELLTEADEKCEIARISHE